MKKWNLIITILLFILGVLCYIFFEAIPMTILSDATANRLLCGAISRFGLSLLFGWLLYQFGGYRYMTFDRRFPKALLWSLPCFMVALVNFPIVAIIYGTARIVRTDLIGLYILYVLGVALLEELIFRGTLLIVVSDYFMRKKHGVIIVVLICSLVFSLFHLTNLLPPANASIGYTLLQCLYTFLIGAMLMVTIIKTRNIWLCILIHALFDFGGLLIIQIGSGNPWDTAFWIFTIVSGVLAAGHIIFTLIRLDKTYVS